MAVAPWPGPVGAARCFRSCERLRGRPSARTAWFCRRLRPGSTASRFVCYWIVGCSVSRLHVRSGVSLSVSVMWLPGVGVWLHGLHRPSWEEPSSCHIESSCHGPSVLQSLVFCSQSSLTSCLSFVSKYCIWGADANGIMSNALTTEPRQRVQLLC